MFSGWNCWTFGKCGRKTHAQLPAAMDELGKTFSMLGEKVNDFEEKASNEFEKAKEFNRANIKSKASRCLKAKSLYKQQIEPLENLQLHITNQMIMLEASKAAAEGVNALKTGSAEMKAKEEEMDIYNVMNEVNAQTESTRQMLQAISVPSGAFDEDVEEDIKGLGGAESPPNGSSGSG